MSDFRRPQAIGDRIEQAIVTATAAGRTPIALALGKEDFPAFQAWASNFDQSISQPDKYRGLRVVHLPNLYLSRLELTSATGLPNSILL